MFKAALVILSASLAEAIYDARRNTSVPEIASGLLSPVV
jgi:hypothetical protein